MTEKSKLENIRLKRKDSKRDQLVSNSQRKSSLTTGQVSGISNLGYSSLYQYVKDFGDLFSPGAQQHKRGRKWGAADVDLVLSIRALRHDNVPTVKIRRKLSGGWRVENHSPWSSQDRDHLVEAFVALTDETSRIMHETENELRDSRWASSLSLEEFQKIQKLEQRQKELEETIYKILRDLHLVKRFDAKKP